MYRVKPEYYDRWQADDENNIVSDDFVRQMANEWDIAVEQLLDQLEEIAEQKEDNMVNWIDRIHEAIGGDYTDDCPIIEEAARELAMRLEYHHNRKMYIDAYNRQIRALAAIEGTEELREAITDKINNGHPYNIKAIQEIIDRGYVD